MITTNPDQPPYFYLTAPGMAERYLPLVIKLYNHNDFVRATLVLHSVTPTACPAFGNYSIAAAYDPDVPLSEDDEAIITEKAMLGSLKAVCEWGHENAKSTDLITRPAQLLQLGRDPLLFSVQYVTRIKTDPHNSYLGYDVKHGEHDTLFDCWAANLDGCFKTAVTIKVENERQEKQAAERMAAYAVKSST